MGGPYVDTNAKASAVDTQVDLLPDDWLQFTGVEDSEHYSLKNIIKGSNNKSAMGAQQEDVKGSFLFENAIHQHFDDDDDYICKFCRTSYRICKT